MQLRPLGRTEIEIPPVIMGTWQAGKQYWVGIDDQEITRAIRAAYDSGITAFDTAEEYGEGHSERVLGAAVKDIRPKVVLMTKVFSNHLRYDQVIASCHGSLRRLQTDYLDLFQVHWPAGSWGSEKVPVEETMRALNDLVAQGKIRAIGVSNFSRAELEEVTAFGRIDSLQPPYSLFWRHIEGEIMPYCQARDISILAYSPLAQGVLSGRFGPDHRFEEGDHRHANKLFLEEHWGRVQSALTALRPIAERNHLTLSQLALAWLTAHQRTHAIAGARSQAQVEENARAMGVVLSSEDVAMMDRIGHAVADPFKDDPVPWIWEP